MGNKKAKAVAAPQLSGPLAAMQKQSLYDLQRAASGKGPSIAREQLKAAQERTLASQIAAAQARPNRNVSGTQRQLIAERGQSGREIAQAGAAGQVAEQLAARDAILAQADMNLNRQAGLQSLEAQRRAGNAAASNQLTGALIGAAGQIGASAISADKKDTPKETPSDKTLKSDIKPAEQKVKSFLDEISSKEYRYKPEVNRGNAKKVGVMAQDLEKSELGKSLVIEKSGKKHIDMESGFSAMLAAQAHLNKRINKLEGSEE